MSNCPQNVVAFVALSALTTLSSSIVFREHDAGQSLSVKENIVEDRYFNNNILVYTLQSLLGSFFVLVILFRGLGAKAVRQREGVALETDI